MISSAFDSTPPLKEKKNLVLGSGSETRKNLLLQAGVPFVVYPAQIDEAVIKQKGEKQGVSPSDSALALAEAKAAVVAALQPESYVIGADQMLSCEGRCYDKPSDLHEARQQLRELRGKTHTLHTAVVLQFKDKVVWKHVTESHLLMRSFSEQFLDDYLTQVGSLCLCSVGAYQVEGTGLQLFERIEGDFFSILGLPLLPLLSALRETEVIFS